ncbi:MAG: GNAT family N-acetyltransferase [Clostridia bacterium]|nr:GNAT family N-acetyltransferase [Clostridia bacterium]
MIFRKALESDIDAISEIYSDTHTEIEEGRASTGWVRGVYPTKETALASLARGDLFVCEDDGAVIGTAIINQLQVDVYASAKWEHPAPDNEVMVLHTLVISPKASRRGYGRAFVDFYERFALENGCVNLRMDTNALNIRAREMYKKLGYSEIGILPCRFNGIEGVKLVLLEKCISQA